MIRTPATAFSVLESRLTSPHFKFLLLTATTLLILLSGTQTPVAAQTVAIGEPTPTAAPTRSKTRTNSTRRSRTAATRPTATAPEASRDTTNKSADTGVSTVSTQVQADGTAGQLRPPTSEEARTLAAQMERLFPTPTDDPVITEDSDGVVKIELDERYNNYSVAKRNADGSISMECVTTKDEFKDFLGIKDAPSATSKVSGATVKQIDATAKPRVVKSSRPSTARQKRAKAQK